MHSALELPVPNFPGYLAWNQQHSTSPHFNSSIGGPTQLPHFLSVCRLLPPHGRVRTFLVAQVRVRIWQDSQKLRNPAAAPPSQKKVKQQKILKSNVVAADPRDQKTRTPDREQEVMDCDWTECLRKCRQGLSQFLQGLRQICQGLKHNIIHSIARNQCRRIHLGSDAGSRER